MNSKGNILAVDDDPQALELLTRVLGEEGYQVQPADSGLLALLSIAAQPPDLILLDVRMPGMDGFEVCRRIKAMEQGRLAPLIFLSAAREVEEWVEGLELGAVDFIPKPFRREELLARVRAHMELGRLRATLEVQVSRRTAELQGAMELLQLEVAERRAAEQARYESEARFRNIANAAPVIIWTSTANHQVDFRNAYTETFTGFTADQLAGDRWEEVVIPEDREEQRRQYALHREARKELTVEYRIRTANGEIRHVLDRATPRYLSNGEFAGYAGIIVDLTEVKQSQERAIAAHNLENVRLLSAGFAHDFQNLVGAIIGETSLALCDLPSGSPGFDSLERIEGIANRAANIVRLMSVYGGDQSNNSSPELINISTLVQEIVPHIRASGLQRADIRTNLHPKLPSVWTQGNGIRQVVLNTIINSVETIKGGARELTITTNLIEAPDGRFVKLEISDSDNGLREPPAKRDSVGQGFGLAAVQGIMQSHNGRFSTRNGPGESFSFEILLPVAD